MATAHHAVVPAAVVVPVASDIELAHRAAALLVRLNPRRELKRTVHELLDQQRLEKLSRESRGLNHWSEHAPKFLSVIVREARRAREIRYLEAETFFRQRHREIVRFALAIVGDHESAEIVASETYRELLEGGVPVVGFFAALVCNARNHLARQSYRREKFVEIAEAFSPKLGTADEPNPGADYFMREPASGRNEDHDPLDVLIAREDEEERQRMLSAAKQDPRWRYIKRRDWAASLLDDVRN